MKIKYFYIIALLLLNLSILNSIEYANKSSNPKSQIFLTDKEKEWLKSHPVITMGVDHNWAPVEFIDKNGQYNGLAAEYYKKLEKILGIKFKSYIPKKTWAEVLEKVKNKEIDIISCAVETKTRKEYALFTKPYLNFSLNIVTNNDVNYIRNLNEVGNKKIAVVKDYAAAEYIKEKYPNIELLEVDSITDALMSVSTKESYAYVGILPSISYYLKKLGYHHLKFSGTLEKQYRLAIGVRDDYPILVSILNKALDQITEEEHSMIYNKWIQLNYTRPVFEKYLVYAVIFLSVIVFMAVYKSLLHKKYSKILEEKNKELEILSYMDTLTKIYNRRKIEDLLSKELYRKRRFDYNISIIMIDIDYFKKVNDDYGHKIGDAVLREFAMIVSKQLRKTDHFGRYGGEEFLIICPDTDLEGTRILAENLLNEIAQHQFTLKKLHITASFGISELGEKEREDDFIKRADDALYYSKKNGRNRISTF